MSMCLCNTAMLVNVNMTEGRIKIKQICANHAVQNHIQINCSFGSDELNASSHFNTATSSAPPLDNAVPSHLMPSDQAQKQYLDDLSSAYA